MRVLIVTIIVLMLVTLVGCESSNNEDGTDKTVGDYILEDLMDG